MTDSPAEVPVGDRRRALPLLLAELALARDRERAQAHPRAVGRQVAALETAREETLEALLRYAEAIEALSWPVPRCIQMEIRMHRIRRTG